MTLEWTRVYHGDWEATSRVKDDGSTYWWGIVALGTGLFSIKNSRAGLCLLVPEGLYQHKFSTLADAQAVCQAAEDEAVKLKAAGLL